MSLLSDTVPLRDTSAWPGFDAIEIIPRVYGRATVKPLRYNEAGTLYVVADHAIAGVDAVRVGGQAIAGWKAYNGADQTGHGVAFLRLSAPLQSGDEIAADVRGLDGNPAAIVADLYPRAALPEFAIYCRNHRLELGGVLAEKMTVRAALSFALEQVGAAWSAGLPGFALPFPPPADGPLAATLGPLDVSNWTVECALENLFTRVTVPFDYDYAAGKARQSITLVAKSAKILHGERTAELALPWVKSSRQAIATATAWLQWRARPKWVLTGSISVQHRSLQPGSLISVSHPRLPVSGEYVLTNVDPGYGSGAVSITAEALPGLIPIVSIETVGKRFDPPSDGLNITYENGVATLVIVDPNGSPVRDAAVVFDGKNGKTDITGTVSFKADPGVHAVVINAAGFAPLEMEITL